MSSPPTNWPTCSGARSEVASPIAMNISCGSATPQSVKSFMKVGSSRRASVCGMSPMEPVTSSANTMPSELGWSALSRASRTLRPRGSISGWVAVWVKTSAPDLVARSATRAAWAACE